MSKPSRANQRQDLVAQRRRLLEKIAQQRTELQAQWAPLHQVAIKGDRVIAVIGHAQRYVQAHRAAFVLVFSVACAVLVLVKPGRSLRLLKNGFLLWRGWRAVQSAQRLVPGSLLGTVFDLIRRRFFPATLR